jgi:hypothetical protein
MCAQTVLAAMNCDTCTDLVSILANSAVVPVLDQLGSCNKFWTYPGQA